MCLFALMGELGPKGTKVVLVRRKARTSTALLKSKATARLRMLRRPANLVRGIAMAAERQLLIELAFHAAEVTPSAAIRKSGSIQSDPTGRGCLMRAGTAASTREDGTVAGIGARTVTTRSATKPGWALARHRRCPAFGGAATVTAAARGRKIQTSADCAVLPLLLHTSHHSPQTSSSHLLPPFRPALAHPSFSPIPPRLHPTRKNERDHPPHHQGYLVLPSLQLRFN